MATTPDNRGTRGSAFRGQVLWLKAQDLAENVAKLVVELKHDRATDAIANQLMRSAGSIAANVAEGYGRFSQAAYRSHLSIARGSTFESESWIDLLARRGHVTAERADLLINNCHEIGRMLTTKMRSLNEGKTYAIGEETVIYGED
jgi:four helix bundle protein